MKDEYTRAREIEEAATLLVKWSEECVADVRNCDDFSIDMAFWDLVNDLKEALSSLDDDPTQIPNSQAKRFWETEGRPNNGRQ